MRKITFFLVMLFMASGALGQNYTAIYTFASVTTSTGLTDPTPVPTATSVTFGSFAAVGQTATNPNASGRFSFTAWPTGATNGIDVFTGSILTTQYYEVTISPADGSTIDINSISFTLQRSGTGIRQYAVRSSVDGYADNLTASINPSNANLSVIPANVFQVTDASTVANTGSTITLDESFDNLSSDVTFRFYGWNAESAGGTFSIDDVVFSGSVDQVLPVNFSNVKAIQQGGGIKVEWSNLTELDVIHYNIERSADGRNFTSIGQVNARLNNDSRADYNFVDGDPCIGINFYRIRSLETTGREKFSIIVKTDIRGGSTGLVLYPNPTNVRSLGFQTGNLAKGQYLVRIINASGQLVYNQSLDHAGGSVTKAIQLPSGIKSGLYTLHLTRDDVKISRTFLVQ